MDANTQNVRTAIRALVPSDGFSITGNIQTESDYDANVAFENAASKPTWGDLQPKITDAQWGVVRTDRTMKLNKCDWTQLGDVPMTESKLEQWQVYRQALRDITTQSDPLNVTWPTAPV